MQSAPDGWEPVCAADKSARFYSWAHFPPAREYNMHACAPGKPTRNFIVCDALISATPIAQVFTSRKTWQLKKHAKHRAQCAARFDFIYFPPRTGASRKSADFSPSQEVQGWSFHEKCWHLSRFVSILYYSSACDSYSHVRCWFISGGCNPVSHLSLRRIEMRTICNIIS